MIPEDDFLLTKPARKETVTAVRIALIALMGCLLLMAVLMIQARAEPDAVLHRQIKTVNQIEKSQAPLGQPAGKPASHPMGISQQ
jgi:hypothetical protein